VAPGAARGLFTLCLDRDLEDLCCFEPDAEGFERATGRLCFLSLLTCVPDADGDEGPCLVVQTSVVVAEAGSLLQGGNELVAG